MTSLCRKRSPTVLATQPVTTGTSLRISMPFAAVAVILLLMATLSALIGHCNNDHKTLIACALYTLAGLTLASGLVVFASVVSDASLERPRSRSGNNPTFQYRYGWSFFSAGAAFVLSELAAVLSVTAYLRRFPSPEEMVRAVVPGAERKLLASRHSDYGVRDQPELNKVPNKEILAPSLEDSLDGPLLKPDLCQQTQCQSCLKEAERQLTGAGGGTLPSLGRRQRLGVLHAGVLGVSDGWSSPSSPSSISSPTLQQTGAARRLQQPPRQPPPPPQLQPPPSSVI